MKLTRQWGFEKITLSPIYFNSLRLKYCLSALKYVNGQILEFGGGAGAFSRAIKHYRPDLSILCTDINQDLINSAKKYDTQNRYQKADIEKLPFQNKSFSAAVSFDVVEHLDNPKLAFMEAHRVLKPKGLVHCAIPLEGSLATIHGFLGLFGLRPKVKYAGHINQFTKNDIVKLLTNSGFNHIEYKYSGHLLYQIADFTYFLSLAIFRKKPDSTMEGYIEILPNGIKKNVLTGFRIVMSAFFFVESTILKYFPGQIGHFTARRK